MILLKKNKLKKKNYMTLVGWKKKRFNDMTFSVIMRLITHMGIGRREQLKRETKNKKQKLSKNT